MGDKNIVLRDLRISYNGAFDLNEFMADVDKWLATKGYDKENKKHSERMTKDGKNIEMVIEAHKTFGKWHFGTLRLRALFNNLKESLIEVKGRKLKAENADVLVYIDGIMETRLRESLYHRKPVYQFVIQIIDKFVYSFWSDKHIGSVVSDGNAFYKNIRSFFSLQKYRFQG